MKVEANNNNNKYKVKKIWNSIIYARKKKDYLLKFYFFVL